MAAIACYEDRDEDIFNSTRAKFIENGITIGNEALQLLCARLSNDRMSNSGEIEKLITYLGDHKNVTVEDVQKIISDASSSSGDDVCFAAAGGYADKALAAFNKLVNEGNEPISIIRSLTYHFNKILTCKAFMENGDTVDKAVFQLQPRIIFFRESSFKRQVSIWPREKLLSVLELLYKCERDCKTTNMPVVEIVSYTLMQISSAAKKTCVKLFSAFFHVSNPAGVKWSVLKRRFLFGGGKGFFKNAVLQPQVFFQYFGSNAAGAAEIGVAAFNQFPGIKFIVQKSKRDCSQAESHNLRKENDCGPQPVFAMQGNQKSNSRTVHEKPVGATLIIPVRGFLKIKFAPAISVLNFVFFDCTSELLINL